MNVKSALESPFVFVSLVAFAALLLYRGLRWSFVTAQPDEWLLRIRNGRLVDAGIGISLFRFPGDVIARFSSTVQRVKFTAQAYSKEHVAVAVDGFVLWTVSAEGEGPFRAFSRLGIANLDKPPRDLKNPKHLFTGPQYHAFQALLVSELQRQVSAMTLERVLSDPGGLVAALDEGLQALCASLGIVLTRVELSQARPLDAAVLKDMAAESEESVREQGSRVRAETAERMEHLTIESATRTAQKKIEDERALGLTRIEAERAMQVRKAELRREAALADERTALEVARARQEREEAELVRALDKTRREAIARRDAMMEINAAEERKSQAVRDYELAQRLTEEIGRAMGQFREPRWISIGQDSPMAAMAGMVAGAREMLSGAANKPS